MHIYIDESEMEGNILLGAILVPDRHRYTLERRLNDLRRRMLREMRSLGYPILDPARGALDRTSRQRTERVRLSAGGLPEIHAAELWAGDQVFWQQRDGTDALFYRHLRWLRAALDLMNEFGITYHTNSLTAVQQRGKLTDREGDVFARLQPVLTKDISAKKFRQLQDDPFVRMLFGTMQALEQRGRGEGWTYQLVCDRGKKNEMFKTFETFDTLKQHGRWRSLSSTDFQESSENALLQLCDAVTYVHAKAGWLPAEHRHKALAQQLYKRSLKGAWRPMAVNDDVEGYLIPGSHAYAELLVMFAEMALLHSGGTAATLEERRRRLQEVIAQYPAQVISNVQGLHRTRRRPQ